MNDISLKEVPTKCLVDELRNREGVQTDVAEPYADVIVQANGPAIILTIID